MSKSKGKYLLNITIFSLGAIFFVYVYWTAYKYTLKPINFSEISLIPKQECFIEFTESGGTIIPNQNRAIYQNMKISETHNSEKGKVINSKDAGKNKIESKSDKTNIKAKKVEEENRSTKTKTQEKKMELKKKDLSNKKEDNSVFDVLG